MPIRECNKRAIEKYHKEHYEYTKLRLNKGQLDQIKQMAAAEGKSQNQFILDKIFKDV